MAVLCTAPFSEINLFYSGVSEQISLRSVKPRRPESDCGVRNRGFRSAAGKWAVTSRPTRWAEQGDRGSSRLAIYCPTVVDMLRPGNLYLFFLKPPGGRFRKVLATNTTEITEKSSSDN
jgi:hypothetical protein